MAKTIQEKMARLMKDVVLFADLASGIRLREYQVSVAVRIVDSILHERGWSFVVMFPRQSGKNELQAQIETYLLALLCQEDAEIVKVSPTWKPQSLNAMRRLERILERNLVTCDRWKKESGYIYRVGRARIFFLSGSPEANIVGATASTLLEVDEAQDVLLAKYDKDIGPMAASTNATKVFWGTAWTSQTLLARELRAARRLEAADGQRRTFVMTAEDVGQEVPAYNEFVKEQVGKLGRHHPMVRTQFFSEEIDGSGGLFPEERRTLMRGEQGASLAPRQGKIYCLLLDVAGEDEEITNLPSTSAASAGRRNDGETTNPGRDSTALTIVEADLSTLGDVVLKAPTYRVVNRRLWTGKKQSALYGEICAIANLWNARWLVVDATGVGAGLASFLDKALPGKVIPFVFSGASKSKLGWNWLAVVDSGRWKEPRIDACRFLTPALAAGASVSDFNQQHLHSLAPAARAGMPQVQVSQFSNQQLFYRQLELCQYEIMPGPEKRLKWSVPDGTRDPLTGEPVHDDLVMSAALSAVLDEQEWTVEQPAMVIKAKDPLREIDHGW